MTATIDGGERAAVAVEGDITCSFQRTHGDLVVHLVAVPARTPSDTSPVLTIEFRVTGMGPTADSSRRDCPTSSTRGGSSEVSLTAFVLESDEVAAAAISTSQFEGENGGMAAAAIGGDFQASIRRSVFAGAN